MRRFMPICALGALLLAGCDSKQVKFCELSITSGLVAPATYKRVSLETGGFLPGKDVEGSAGADAVDTVRIAYDAQNSFGTPLRDTRLCAFRKKGGNLMDEKRLQAMATTAQYQQTVIEKMAGFEADAGKETPIRVACCMPDDEIDKKLGDMLKETDGK